MGSGFDDVSFIQIIRRYEKMRIFIDIGHPAHVHYFKNFIKIMKNRGHSFLITARNKEITHNLLNNFNIDFVDRGVGGQGMVAKFLYMFKADMLIYKLAKILYSSKFNIRINYL